MQLGHKLHLRYHNQKKTNKLCGVYIFGLSFIKKHILHLHETAMFVKHFVYICTLYQPQKMVHLFC